jgi:phosphoserine phosphatase
MNLTCSSGVRIGKEIGERYMTSYVLTLIAKAGSVDLETDHIDRIFQSLAMPGEIDWLAEKHACDLFIESSLSAADIAGLAQESLNGVAIDAVCTSVVERRKKILICDMDSTIIDQECIDELGDAIGRGSQIREITAAVVSGDMSFSDALRKRMALMKGMNRDLLERIYKDRISVKTGARTFVQTMRRHGAYCILVSGGFSFFTRRIAERVGFHDHQGNELVFEHDKLTGEVLEPILGRTAKQKTLMRLCDERGLTPSDVLAVGDGANDIKMIDAAGLGVAFHGAPSLKERADGCIDHGDLTAILYVQGFRKSEFAPS